MFDENLINNVIEQADIAQIIAQYIPLEKKGADYKGLCPFHKDSHPSLSVSPAKKVFKCFSCGEAGNVIQFVQKFKHISFVEALQEVAATCNIDVPIDKAQSQRLALTKRYQNIIDETISFYQFCLRQTKEGQSALNYLHNRQLSDDVIDHFRIGVAPKGHNKLYNYLKTKDVLELDALKLGIIQQDDNNNFYDYFRQRVTFPLDDVNGKYVGISARIFETENPSKYLTTAENDLFHKSYLLYHYQEAAKTATLENHIYLLEGFMDVIALYRAGIMNAVASLGTSLTTHQIEALLKLTKNITIIYDGDMPGVHATQKAIKLFKNAGVTPTACLFPKEYKDADEYINSFGADGLQKYLKEHTQSALDYLYDSYRLGRNLQNTEEAEAFLNDVFTFLKDLGNPIYINASFKRLEQDLGLSNEALNEKFNDFVPISNNTQRSNKYNPMPEDIPADIPPEYPLDYPTNPVIDKPENTLVNKYYQAEERLIYIEYINKSWACRIESKLKDNYVNYDLYSIRKAILVEYENSDKINDNMLKATLGTDLSQKLETICQNKVYSYGTNSSDFGNNYINDLINKIIEYVNLNTNNKQETLLSVTQRKKKTVRLK